MILFLFFFSFHDVGEITHGGRKKIKKRNPLAVVLGEKKKKKKRIERK